MKAIIFKKFNQLRSNHLFNDVWKNFRFEIGQKLLNSPGDSVCFLRIGLITATLRSECIVPVAKERLTIIVRTGSRVPIQCLSTVEVIASRSQELETKGEINLDISEELILEKCVNLVFNGVPDSDWGSRKAEESLKLDWLG